MNKIDLASSYYNLAEMKDKIGQLAICRYLEFSVGKLGWCPTKVMRNKLSFKCQFKKVKYRAGREVASQWIVFSTDPVLQSICLYH